MTPDPDVDPERPESASAPEVLPAAEHRAVDAAVAGVAGLLIGRALFGRAGGLVAGLAAVGAGLLAKRRPQAKKDQPAAPPPNGAEPAAEPAPVPAVTTQVRLETGHGTVDDNWATLAACASPNGFAPLIMTEEKAEAVEPLIETAASKVAVPDDAGAFAEMPALFGPDGPRVATAPIPAPDVSPFVEEPVVFDDGPAPVEVNTLPVAELVSRAEQELEKEDFPVAASAPARSQTGPVPLVVFPGMLEDLPAEFSEYKEEEEPGPREDFLLIPDQPFSAVPVLPVPPIQSVVAALSESLESPAAAPWAEKVAEPEIEIKATAAAEPAAPVDEAPTGTPPFAELPPSPAETAAPHEPATDSPFRLWESSSTSVTPPPVLVIDEKPPVAPVPPSLPPLPFLPATAPAAVAVPAAAPAAVNPVPLVPPVPAIPTTPAIPHTTAADPEEIWRQAAAELTALRNSPALPVSPIPLPITTGIPSAAAPAFPPLPSTTTAPPPGPVPVPQVPQSDLPVPPWLRPPPGEEMPKPEPEHDPSRHKSFLPTIKLSVPQGPQPLSARRPLPLPPETAPASEPVPAPLATPVALSGYRAEALPPILPAAASTEPITDIDAPLPPIFPPLPKSLAAVTTAAVPAGPMAPPPIFANAGQTLSSDGPEKVFVPRTVSSRHAPPPYKRRAITPLRVGILAIAAVAALGIAYKPQLKELWEQRILGKQPSKSRDPGRIKTPEPKLPPSDGSDVRIAPDPPKPPDSANPATPAPGSVPQPSTPAIPSPQSSPAPSSPVDPPVPSTTPQPAESVIAADPAPPPANPPSTGPLPVSEAGARELISNLVSATTSTGVKPYILDAVRLAPALESYFSSGKSLPFASFESHLERAEKDAATGRSVWLFRVTTDDVPRGFPVAVEHTADGLRADWELFSQCRDGALQAFLSDPSAPPGVYYVALKRAHLFPDMLPGLDHTKFFAFEISSPTLGNTPVNAFIPKDSRIAARADNLYKFSTFYSPVLELAHKDGHVEITGIVRENWRTRSTNR